MRVELPEIIAPAKFVLDASQTMNDEEYFEFCANNTGLRIERTSQGDLSMAKLFRLGSVETRTLEVRAESFNTLNHFNPNNPNAGLTYNFLTGAQTNASFGTIGGAQVNSRRIILSMRIRF